MKRLTIVIALILSYQAGADGRAPGHLIGPMNVDVFYTIGGQRRAESANYIGIGDLQSQNGGVAIPVIDLHPSSVGYLRIGFSKTDTKGVRTGDYVGMVRFLNSFTDGEYYVDQIELGSSLNEGRISIPGLGSEFFDIAKTCVRYVYLKTIAGKLEKRTIFLKGSTLVNQDFAWFKSTDPKNECEIRPVN